jgi:hypothetical protein
MRRVVAALAVALSLITPAPAAAWSLELHRFIMDRAIELLPPGLKPFFVRNRATVVERAVDPDTWRTMGFAEEAPNHFLNIDSPGYGPFPFLGLPHVYAEAVRKFGVERVRANGTLPWRIQEFHARVAAAFRNINSRANGRFELVHVSAVLSHYVADATQPLHAASNFDGQLTGQRGVHARFERTLFQRYRSQVTIAPIAMPPVTDPLAFAFDTIIASWQLAQPLLAADRNAIGAGDRYDDAYFDGFFGAARPVLEERIGVAIAAVAAAITGAWGAAGQPVVSIDAPRVPPQRRRRP